MSSALINRSLTNIRTELDFLLENGVISRALYDRFNRDLPERWPANGTSSSSSNVEYMEAIYDFKPQEDTDLPLRVGDKIEVLEKLSADWYRGRCNGRVGTFPANYVKPAFSGGSSSQNRSSIDTDNERRRRIDDDRDRYAVTERPPPGPPTTVSNNMPVTRPNGPPPGQAYQQPYDYGYDYGYQQPPPPPPPQQPQYAPYYQQPPPPPGPPVQQQIPVQPVVIQQAAPADSGSSSALKNFGKQLGSAAIFGAGATMGSDLVNSIF